MKINRIACQRTLHLNKENDIKLWSARMKEADTENLCGVKLLPSMVSVQHTQSEVHMQLSLKVFDASLHQDRATMSGSFCSWSTSNLATNKWVTVCSFGNNTPSNLF